MRENWVDTFLKALKHSPNVSAAARVAGIERTTAYKFRKDDVEFAEAWDEAIEQSVDDLVGRCYEKAMRCESDVLAIFLLKSLRREVFGDVAKVQNEHSGPDGGPIRIEVGELTDDELRSIVEGKGGG